MEYTLCLHYEDKQINDLGWKNRTLLQTIYDP
jgi:hypothetical protein